MDKEHMKQAEARIAEMVRELKLLFHKIRMHGKMAAGFQRGLQALEQREPLFVIMAQDCGELSFKRVVLDACSRREVYVSQRLPKALLAQALSVKEKEAQVCVITDFGPKWTPDDKRTFEKWFL